jgi:hypothetical protein
MGHLVVHPVGLAVVLKLVGPPAGKRGERLQHLVIEFSAVEPGRFSYLAINHIFQLPQVQESREEGIKGISLVRNDRASETAS